MKRDVLLAAFLSSVLSIGVTLLAVVAVLPSVVHAQVQQMTAAGLLVVRPDGLPGVSAEVRPAGGGVLEILGVDGRSPRISLGAGGGPMGGPINPAAAGIDIRNSEGIRIIRVGTIGAAAAPQVALRDASGTDRYIAELDADGNPSIQMMDAFGNVIWRAPNK